MFQRDPKRTAYRTGGNYPAQENTGQASVPESQGIMPSAKRLSMEDYMALMHQTLGTLAEDMAQTKAMIAQAEERTAVITATKFDTAYSIPQDNRYRTAYISRPSKAESQSPTGLTAEPLTIYWDDGTATLVPFNAQTVAPIFGAKSFTIKNSGPNGAGTYPGSWALDVVISTRPYNPSVGMLSLDGGSVGILSATQATDTQVGYLAATNTGATGALVVGDMFWNATAINWSKVRTPTVWKVVNGVAITAGTPVSVWTPTPGDRFRLMGFDLSVSVQAAIKFIDGTVPGTVLYETGVHGANQAIDSVPMGNGILSGADSNSLYLDVTASGTVTGTIWGTQE